MRHENARGFSEVATGPADRGTAHRQNENICHRTVRRAQQRVNLHPTVPEERGGIHSIASPKGWRALRRVPMFGVASRWGHHVRRVFRKVTAPFGAAFCLSATVAFADTPPPAPPTLPPVPIHVATQPPGDLAAAMLAANAASPVPPRIPSKVFATIPLLSEPLLSPDGLRFAARTNVDGQKLLGIFDLSGKTSTRLLRVGEDADLRRYMWAGNDTLLVSVGRTINWMGDDALETRLMAIDAPTGAHRFIGGDQEGLIGDDILWIDPAGKSILLSYQSTIYEYPTVFSVDLAHNRRTRVAGPIDDIWDWYADNAGVVRYGYGWSDDHHWQMVYRKDAATPFRVAAHGTDADNDQANADKDKAFRLSAGSDTGFVYDTDADTGLQAIYRYNFATHTRGDLVFEAQGTDIDNAWLTTDGTGVESAYYTDSRDRVTWWDPEMRTFQDQLDHAVGNALGDREAWVVSHSTDYATMIVWVLASNDPGRYYVYQKDTGTMSVLSKLNETLTPASLAVTHYVHYKARDGLDIPAYVTLPVGRAAQGLPLVVMPHGGPYDVRDHGDYADDVQFLANRGYVVLQPEYRGSGSYGKAFDDKGSGQWGRAMQDDIDDGMDWLVKAGIADPKRACIVGWSYGGYAAIWGATRNPERWRCAVSAAGISDLGRQLKYQINSMTNRPERARWQRKVQGDPAFDLKTVSGLYNLDRMKVPILLVHGDKDQTVPPKQSRLYAAALKAAGKTYEYVELPGETHGLSTSANAQTWYDRLDAFLAKYDPAG